MDDAPTTPPSHAELVKRFKIAGTFAIPDRGRVLKQLRAGERLLLVREPDNPYDDNAIRVDSEIGEHKIGYVPRADAAELARQLDAGFCCVGIIADIDRDRGEIFADLYKRILLPLDGVTNFTFTENWGFGHWPPKSARYTMSFRQRKFVYEERLDMVEVHRFEIVFSEEKWPAIRDAVNKCNFLAWDGKYYSDMVFDAGYWQLSLRMRDNRLKHCDGNIYYPEEWDIFMKLLRDCRNLSEFKGNGSFRIIPWGEYCLKRRHANKNRVSRHVERKNP